MTRMIRRFLCLALAAVMMAALLPFAVSGTTAKAASSTGIVTLEGVNFRVGPSMKDKVLFKISKGTVCPVLNKVTANGYDWYEVTGKDPEFGREYTGYIRGDCFRMLSEGESGNNGNSSAVVTAKPANSSATANNLPAPANAVGTINNWGVNFRSAPWGNVLASLDKGTQVTVLTVPQTVSRQNWYQVQYNGQQGYIMATYLDYSGKTAKPTATPAPGAATPTPAPGGTTPTAAPVVNPDNNGEILGYVMTIKGSVNIRASIGGTSLTQVGIYETFPYLLTPVRRGSYTWYFIQMKNGVKGYIRGDCVKVTSNPGNASTTVITAAPGNSNVVTAAPGNSSVVTAAPGSNTDTPTGYVSTTMDDVNVRKGVWGDLVTVVKKAGTTFPYYGEPRLSGSTKWYFIKGDFGYAYIHGGYVKVTGSSGKPTATPAPTNTTAPGPTTQPSNNGSQNEASYTTLRPGSSGTAVLNLVRELKNQGFYSGAETNKYNSAVENAVRAFQKAKGLAVDGIAGNDTQHKLFNTVPIGTTDLNDLSMTLYPAEKIDWNTGGIDELWPRGSNFKIYDVKSGIVFWAHRWSGGLHIDAEPLTAADTARICKIQGVSKASEITEKTHWMRRPALVTIGTRTFACSMFLVPHNPDGDTISDNNFVGQFCIHFTNSKTHESKKVDSQHAEAIEYAYQNAPNGHK